QGGRGEGADPRGGYVLNAGGTRRRRYNQGKVVGWAQRLVCDQRGQAFAAAGGRLQHRAVSRRRAARRLGAHLEDTAALGDRALQHRAGCVGKNECRRQESAESRGAAETHRATRQRERQVTFFAGGIRGGQGIGSRRAGTAQRGCVLYAARL